MVQPSTDRGTSELPGGRCFLTWVRALVPALLLAAMILVGACDLQVLEPWDPPRWGVSLTLPLVNKTYELNELVNDSTIFQDTTTREIQIEFRGQLDTTSIDPEFLEVELPAEATPDPINEVVYTPDAADFFSAVEESITVTIALDSVLQATGQPLFADLSFPAPIDVIVPDSVWNNFVSTQSLEQQEGPFELVDTTTLIQDNAFIKRMRYVQLTSTPGASEFATTVISSDFPTSVDSIHLDLSSGPLSVTHETATLAPGNTFTETTDLASEKLGSEISMAFGMVLPAVGADVTIPAGDAPQIEFTISLGVGGVDSVAITTERVSLLEDPLEPLPLPEDIQITSGVLRSGELPPLNQISLSGLSNTMPFDIYFKLTFPNFDSPAAGNDSLSLGPDTLIDGRPPINRTTSLGGYTFHNPAGADPIESFEYEVTAEILEKDIVLPLDGSALGAFQATFSVGDLYFTSITGKFGLEFPTVPTTIDEIPTGFEGFKFDRLSLKLTLCNEINLPVVLDLDLTGVNDRLGSETVPINAPINYPNADPSNSDSAKTVIILDKNSVRTYWLPEGAWDIGDAWWDTTVTADNGATIVDVLNLAPDTIKVGGSAIVEDKEGTIEVDKAIWGEFELIAPFAFILPWEISFLPVDAQPLEPMDEDTRTQIREALLSASLTSTVENNFPLGGKISMLASDTTLFTLALDKLDDIAFGIPDTVVRDGDTTIYDNIDSVLALDGITGVSHFVYYPDAATAGQTADPRLTRAKRVDFYTSPADTAPAFWIGRLFEMAVPTPRAVSELGYVITPGDTIQEITLDADRVAWIASERTVYLKPFITFFSATGPRTLQSDNSISMAVFVTFNLTSDIFEVAEEPDTSDITVWPISNVTIDLGDTVFVNLDTVFSHQDTTKKAKDLDLSAASSHTGIATATIRTIRIGDGTRKVLWVFGVGLGTAEITLSADDDPDDEIDPVKTRFLVTVMGSEGEEEVSKPVVSKVGKWGILR